MNWTRQALKEDSKMLLKLNYWPFVLVALIHSIVAGNGGSVGISGNWNNVKDRFSAGSDDFSSLELPSFDGVPPYALAGLAGIVLIAVLFGAAIGIAVAVLLLHPLEVGCKRYMVLARSVKPQYGEIVYAFKSNYWNIVKVMFFKNLFTFLWSLLFIVPGIIKSYEYRMIPYLLAENSNLSYEDAFRLSKEMMMGNKLDTFVLDLSFIGWHLLGVITCGLVELFFVAPYELLTNCALYLHLKSNHPAFGGYYQQDVNGYMNGM